MSAAQADCKGVLFRHRYQVDVVAHQAVSQNADPRPDRYTPSINPSRHGGLAACERRSIDLSHAELLDGEIRAIRAGHFEAYACRVSTAEHFSHCFCGRYTSVCPPPALRGQGDREAPLALLSREGGEIPRSADEILKID